MGGMVLPHTQGVNSARVSAETRVVEAGQTAPMVQALREQDAAEQKGAASFYEFFLSYSADFASGKPK